MKKIFSFIRRRKFNIIKKRHLDMAINVDDSNPNFKFFQKYKHRKMVKYGEFTPYVNGKKVRLWKFIGFSNEYAMYVPMFYKNDRRVLRPDERENKSINQENLFPSKLDYPYET